jgi:hypothetical protein
MLKFLVISIIIMNEKSSCASKNLPKKLEDLLGVTQAKNNATKNFFDGEGDAPNYHDYKPLLKSDPKAWLLKMHDLRRVPLNLLDIKDMYGQTRGRKVCGGDEYWSNFVEKVYVKSIKKGRLQRDENGYTSLPM